MDTTPEIRWLDEDVIVCLKPAGVLSTDEPGGLPGLLRQALDVPEVYTVHRLDRVVSGLMVLARTRDAAAALGRQIMERSFGKEYLAVVHGAPPQTRGTLRDLLGRDRARRMTFVADGPGRGVQEAVLDYEVLGRTEGLSLVRVVLHTGRTHQIRVQFASRGLPLAGERKYAVREDGCPLALWSHALTFTHPGTGRPMAFTAPPPPIPPWDRFPPLPKNK